MMVRAKSAETKIILLIVLVAAATAFARAQTAALATSSAPAGAPALATSVAAGSNSSSFFGSVPVGRATSTVMPLTLQEAIERGLKTNLGILLSEQSSRAARGARWEALSHLLPHLTTGTTETRQQINFEALGFPPSAAQAIPDFPIITPPFNTFDARASLSAPLLDLEHLHRTHAAADELEAAHYNYDDARNMVVLVIGNAYLECNAAQARVQAAAAELNTAQALDRQAADRFHAGLSPEIDEDRAEVEVQSRHEQLLAARNTFATDKLDLARAIGLPLAQRFSLATKNPYAPLAEVTLAEALDEAYRNRPDYQAALVSVQSARQARRAVRDERLPSVSFISNFGDIGLTPGNSHETFLAAGTLKIPIFQGGRVHGAMIQANAQLKEAEDRAQNLRAQIDYDVRTALMNLKTAALQVNVAQSNIALANRTLQQARDRFAAGVTDNIEVVEAQEAVASANETYISSLYEHNLAKVSLAHAIGIAAQAAMQYLGGK
jgi:outer membrane protein TolC